VSVFLTNMWVQGNWKDNYIINYLKLLLNNY
jgi:hypothetical protein